MGYRATKSFSSPLCGNKVAGDRVSGVPHKYIDYLVEMGFVEDDGAGPFQKDGGLAELSSSLPPAPASADSSSNESSDAGNKTGAESSQSTAPESQPDSPTSTTPVTKSGGTDTELKAPPKPKSGRATKKPQPSTV